MSLIMKIKDEKRIHEMFDISYSVAPEGKYGDWCMELEREFTPLSAHCVDFVRHKVLHHSDNKTVFVVEDIKIQKHYILKEILNSGTNPRHPSMNEHNILKALHACSGPKNGANGICKTPGIIQGLVTTKYI